MTEVVDLTFNDSDDEPELRRRSYQAQAPSAAAEGLLSTPTRRLLNDAALAATETNLPSPPPTQQQAASPEEIDLVSPEPPVYRQQPSQPRQRQAEREELAAPAREKPNPRPARNTARSTLFNPADYENEFAEEKYDEPDYQRPTNTTSPAAAGARGRKPKRTREEIQRDKELKKQQKAAETAARKLASQYNSDRHVLRYLTVILDPELMGSPVGLKIAEAFQQTQAQQAEHERITYKVASTGLGGGFRAIKWLRKVPTAAAVQGSQQDAAGPSNYMNTVYNVSAEQQQQQLPASPQQHQQTLIDQEEPHILICFEAEEFIAAVQRDSLTTLFTRLHQHCPEHRPHLLVHRLDHCLTKKEREDFKRTMGNGVGVGGGGAGPSGFGGVQQQSFNRIDIDDFISKMAIEAPQVGFRDVVSTEEGAAHVCSLTRAIARRLLEKNDASKYLLSTSAGANKKSNQNTASLLASYPVEDPGIKTFLGALCALPSVGPQIAHAVALKYGSLGNLMEMLFDPRKSYADKIREIEFIPRTGSGRVTKVGPKAAKQLFEILTGVNPDAPVHEDRS